MAKALSGCAEGRAGDGLAPPARVARRRPGFTLVELLVVIMIIALLIAIILPALAGARTVAKSGATRQFIGEITKAAESWKLDKSGKAPGYFNARDMGHSENATRGFTAMQNVMLDLMGGIAANGDVNAVEVGPRADPATHVWVNIGLMGSQKGYFSPDGRFVKPQDGSDGGTQASTVPEHQKLPSLVDAWGNPLLFWMEDQTAIGGITTKDQFAQIDSTNIALFYWNSNAGLLNSTALGRSAKNQNYGGVGSEYSLIGGGVPVADVQDSLIGILGNPSFPNTLDPPYDKIVPTQSRGRTVIESAGPDAMFFGSHDKGYNRLDHVGPEFKEGVIRYVNNFFFNNGAVTRFKDDKGNPTTEPVTEKFDEILVSGGN